MLFRSRFGAQLRYGVEVKMKPEYKTEKGEKTQMFFGYEHQVLLFMSFTDDLFSLIMQGNTFSIGDFMDIGGTYFSNFDFHKVYAGSMRTFGKNNQYVFGVAPFMSFHKPPLIVDITKGSIETKADTSSIQAKISGKMISGLKQEKFVQSIGGGIDLFIGFKEILNDYYVELSLKNFGVYGFEGRRVMVDSDGMVNISGVHLNNLNHPDSAMINYVDSISDEFGFSNDTLINSVMLPYCVSLEVISLNKKNYSLSGRISYYPGQHMLPFVEIFPQYRFNKFFQVGIPVAWGGMGGLFAGAMQE